MVTGSSTLWEVLISSADLEGLLLLIHCVLGDLSPGCGGAFAPRLSGLHCAPDPAPRSPVFPNSPFRMHLNRVREVYFMQRADSFQKYLQRAEMHQRMVVASVRLLWM